MLSHFVSRHRKGKYTYYAEGGGEDEDVLALKGGSESSRHILKGGL